MAWGVGTLNVTATRSVGDGINSVNSTEVENTFPQYVGGIEKHLDPIDTSTIKDAHAIQNQPSLTSQFENPKSNQ